MRLADSPVVAHSWQAVDVDLDYSLVRAPDTLKKKSHNQVADSHNNINRNSQSLLDTASSVATPMCPLTERHLHSAAGRVNLCRRKVLRW